MRSLSARRVGIQRRKQHVGGLHVRAGQPVKQGRFAGVGVADQRHHAVRHALPPGAMQPPRRLNLFQFVFQPRDAIADQTAVGFDLGLAGPPMNPKPPRWRSRWSTTAPDDCAGS